MLDCAALKTAYSTMNLAMLYWKQSIMVAWIRRFIKVIFNSNAKLTILAHHSIRSGKRKGLNQNRSRGPGTLLYPDLFKTNYQ